MNWLWASASRVASLFRKRRFDEEIDEQLLFHLEMEADENVRNGMSAGEARRRARLRLGGLDQVKEEYRDVRGLPWLESACRDVSVGLRMLRKSPGFTAAAVLSLALGIGANAAIFTVFHALVLKPPPYPQPGELVRVWESFVTPGGRAQAPASMPDLRDWRDRNDAFIDIGGYVQASFHLTGTEDPIRVVGAQVEPDVFRVLGVEPSLGRTLLPEENEPGRERVVVLSHELWERRYGGAPEIIGKTIEVNGADHVVAGVMPPEFQFPPRSGVEMWAPLTVTNTLLDPKDRDNHWIQVVARLKPDVSLGVAQANMDAVTQRINESLTGDPEGKGARLEPLQAALARQTAPILIVLWGAVGFVLLIACANVANMLLARSTTRHREFAVRLALGASRWRVTLMLMMESLLLASAGGALGLLICNWSIDLMRGLPYNPLPPSEVIAVDSTILLYCVAVTLLTALLSGIAPAFGIHRAGLHTTLKSGGPAPGVTPRQNRQRKAFLTVEVALALAVLIGAGLMVSSLRQLTQLDFGFRTENVLTMRISLPGSKYPSEAEVAGFYDRVLEGVGSIPGVNTAGLINQLPVQAWGVNGNFSIEGRTWPDRVPFIEHRTISSDYFKTLSIRLVSGRYFSQRDGRGDFKTAIISRQAAEIYFPDEDPIGRRMTLGTADLDERWRTIVGVVDDARIAGANGPIPAVMYEPYPQFAAQSVSLLVHSALPPESLVNAVRHAVVQEDPDQPVFLVKTMEQVIYDSASGTRFVSFLLGCFSSLSLVLAAVGIYGVMSYIVSQRTHEIGLRMAVGANRSQVLRSVLTRGLRMSAPGLVVGVVTALVLSRLIQRFVIGITSVDPATYLLATLIIVAVVVAGCYLPARRAARIEPVNALRHE